MAAIHNALAALRASGAPTPVAFTYTISTNQTNLNLRTAAIAAGWDSTGALTAIINSGVYVSSNSTATPALTVDGSYPAGVSLTNNGIIAGMGGAGGNGASILGSNSYTSATNGQAGGLALQVSSAISINNTSGTIAGGGGGGGGGGALNDYYNDGKSSGDTNYAGNGGGGGQTGQTNSSGGFGGAANAASYGNFSGNNGFVGTASGGGAAGNATNAVAGGAGGSYGNAGAAGESPTGYSSQTSGGAGGAAGGAVSGNSNITWTNTGSRLGSIT